MKYLILLLVLTITGCGMTPQEDKLNKTTNKLRGQARTAMFIKCMELAAKMPRKGDDDVSDIVSECSSSSRYITNYIEAEK